MKLKMIFALMLFPFWVTYCQMQDESSVDMVETTICESTETTTSTDILTTVTETMNETTHTMPETYILTTSTGDTTTSATTTTANSEMVSLGSFKATYYKGSKNPCNGGSGRVLSSCYVKDDEYKGSVASRLVYESYGYFKDGIITVYVEFPAFPQLDGYYSVDDCNADVKVFDFYFADYGTCPWGYDGVTICNVWI